jgi:predicted methyltransferase
LIHAWSARLSRRRFCLNASGLAGAGLLLGACGRKEQAAAGAASTEDPAAVGPSGPSPGTLEWAAAGDWRPAEDKARDAWRHPVQSLRFWGLKPGMTVLEIWPGIGWYSDIVAPYLARSGGRLIGAQFQVGSSGDPSEAQILDTYRKKLAARPGLYGQPILTAFGPTSGPIAPDGSVDLILMLRNVHSFMMAGIADKAFHDAFKALKSGGLLGIEEHRAAPGGVQDVLAADGYVQEDYVKQLALEAGFRFDGASEINANPKDVRNYPFGVSTLPPTRQSAPAGKPDDPKFDHAKYDAIGESDRMTLRFVKP